MIRAACLVLFCCSFSAVTAQQAVAQGARTTETVVVRSASPALRHVGARHTRFVVPTTAAVPASATAKATTARRLPSLRFLQVRR